MRTPHRRQHLALTAMCAAVLSLSTTPALSAAGAPAASGERVLVMSTSAEAAAARVHEAGGSVERSYPLAGAVYATLPARHHLSGARIVANAPLEVNEGSASTSPAQDAAALVGSTNPRAGAGVIVAVVDTGVADVAQLRDAVVGRIDVTGQGAGDGYGHGTFMAGLIAARGVEGAGRGVAPGAQILDVRVADAEGRSDLAQVLSGIEAVAAAHAQDERVRVMNLSMSIPDHGVDAGAAQLLSTALTALQQEGVSVIVPAGNDGPAPGSITAPGSNPTLLTAGALDTTTASASVARFSGQGLRNPADSRQVDLVAPGVSVLSVRAPGSAVDLANPQARVGTTQFRGSGTSMSAAVTAGAAAAVSAAHPALSPAQIAASLTLSAQPVEAASREASGAGRIALPGAIEAGAKIVSGGLATGQALTGDPRPGDEQVWAEFAAAWEAGDATTAARAWSMLSPQTQQWAKRMWSEALWRSGSTELQARAWSARAWSGEEWVARAWSARAWSDLDWAARAWSARAWSARAWSGRAWSARAWSGEEWTGRAWSGRAWSGEEWAGRAWSARAWSTTDWS